MEQMPRRGFSSSGFERGGESEFDAAVRRIVTVVVQERSQSIPRMTLPEWEQFVRGVLTDPLEKYKRHMLRGGFDVARRRGQAP